MWKIMCSDEDNDHTLSIKDIMEHKAEGYVECPLKKQSFRWIREKYQLFQEIQIDQTSSPKFCFKIIKFIGNPINLSEKEWYWEEVKVVDWFLYKTYEEAEDACLDKLIEICKK